METAKQLANRFREVLLDGRWIANTNLKEVLTDVTWEQANYKIRNLNTIAALTFHVNYYIDGILNVFRGGTLDIRDKFSFDAPEIQSQTDWEGRMNDLWRNAEEFAKHVESMSDEALGSTFIDEKYGTYRRNIEAMIEHSYYHFGQISLIKKMTVKIG